MHSFATTRDQALLFAIRSPGGAQRLPLRSLTGEGRWAPRWIATHSTRHSGDSLARFKSTCSAGPHDQGDHPVTDKDTVDIDIDEPTHERIVAYAEQTGITPEAAAEQMLADPLTLAHDAIRALLRCFERELTRGY